VIQIIFNNSIFYTPKFLTFSGGEEHVNIEYQEQKEDLPIIINSQITSSTELMRLLLTTDSLRRLYDNDIELFIPYIPYARQDRACQLGDSFSLEVFANIISSQKYSKVTVVDPHSPVSHELFKNINVITQERMIDGVNSRLRDIDYIVSPDMGASRKAKDWMYRWNYLGNQSELILATKKRNELGEIIATEVNCGDITGSKCLIVDDICDGGRTFTELAKVLRDKGSKEVYLYVTHGIFAKVLPLEGIDKVFTTDSLPEKDDGRIIVKRFFN